MAGSNVLALPVAPARPEIELDGQARPELASALLAMRITDAVDDMAALELTLGAWGGAVAGMRYMDRQLVDFGKPLTIRIDGKALFDGRISAIGADFPDGGPPVLRVCAEDRLQDLRMTRRSRTFEQMSPGDIVRRIAGEHNLQAQVSLDGPVLAAIAQLNQSDLAFIISLARQHGAQAWASGNALHFAAARDTSAVELHYSGTLRSFEVVADLAHQRSAMVASGWDVAQRAGVSHRAEESAIQSELGALQSGGSILASAFAERVDTLAHRMPGDAGEARALAEAAYRQAARRFVTGRGCCRAHSDLVPGGKVKLDGVGALFEGEYHITRTEHRFDAREGLVSEFACERAGIGRP